MHLPIVKGAIQKRSRKIKEKTCETSLYLVTNFVKVGWGEWEIM